MTANLHELYRLLCQDLQGDVHFDAPARHAYSTDASLYEILPKGVVAPKSAYDVVTAVTLARAYHLPITARGAGTGLAGGCLTQGLVIDTSKYLNKILEVNVEGGYCICEPGVVQDHLNKHLYPHGMCLGPDTSTGNRATLGGMLAANSAGARSLLFGSMADHILGIEIVLSNGEVLTLGPCDSATLQAKSTLHGQEGVIFRTIQDIRLHHRDEIRKHFPPLKRRVSGYALDTLLPDETCNIARLIAGSEGTLGIVTKMVVKISPIPPHTGLCLIQSDNLLATLKALPQILAHNPLSVELLDSHLLAMGKISSTVHDKLSWLVGSPQAVIAIELQGTSQEDLFQKLETLASQGARAHWGYSIQNLVNKNDIADVWAVRKAAVGLLLARRSYSRALAFIEDMAVPPEHVAAFVEKLQKYLASLGKDAGIYGHIGAGCLHLRPYLDLREPPELALMQEIQKEAATLVMAFGGAMSGEHGDGLVRSWLNPTLFGDAIYALFKRIKEAFDPENLMNPGKIVGATSPQEHLRLDPTTPQRNFHTFLDFSKEGSFELAVDMCNGNGECRKSEGIMCPSFQATLDERHTTRARANLLRSVITDRHFVKTLGDKEVYDILDLCLECKGCKTECPSSVDMAKMKAEALYHHHQKHPPAMRTRLFAAMPDLLSWASLAPTAFNILKASPLAKAWLKHIGITTTRHLPDMAPRTFSKIAKSYPSTSKPPVVLFNDTYTEYYHPHLGQMACDLFSHLGYNVIIPPRRCCGKPWFSKGFLPQAREKALAIVHMLYPYAEKKIPIVILEPSCLFAIRDDYPALLPEHAIKVSSLTSQCLLVEEFLAPHSDALVHNLHSKKVWHHTHCHQQALATTTLQHLGIQAITTPKGCCGMAGAFGYESEHTPLSDAIANISLVPTLQKASPNDVIIANGFSCRNQIAHHLATPAVHLIEALQG